MCNLYSITSNQEAIRALFRKVNRYVGNLAPMPGVLPDYPAPVIRTTDEGEGRERVVSIKVEHLDQSSFQFVVRTRRAPYSLGCLAMLIVPYARGLVTACGTRAVGRHIPNPRSAAHFVAALRSETPTSRRRAAPAPLDREPVTRSHCGSGHHPSRRTVAQARSETDILTLENDVRSIPNAGHGRAPADVRYRPQERKSTA
jgi:hypothetical protein